MNTICPVCGAAMAPSEFHACAECRHEWEAMRDEVLAGNVQRPANSLAARVNPGQPVFMDEPTGATDGPSLTQQCAHGVHVCRGVCDGVAVPVTDGPRGFFVCGICLGAVEFVEPVAGMQEVCA